MISTTGCLCIKRFSVIRLEANEAMNGNRSFCIMDCPKKGGQTTMFATFDLGLRFRKQKARLSLNCFLHVNSTSPYLELTNPSK